MTNYFTALDLNQLENYAIFSDKLPTSLLLSKSTLDLGSTVDSRQYRVFELDKLISRAKADANTWRGTQDAVTSLHRDVENFIDEFILLSQQALRAPGIPQSTRLFEFATSNNFQFLKTFNQQQQTAVRLATGTYTVLPRLIEYMYNNIYLYAQREHTRSNANSIKFGPAWVRISGSISVALNPTSAYRYAQAMEFIDAYQREYALSHMAYSNLTAHLTRLKEMTAQCVFQSLQLRTVTKPSRLKASLDILLVSLREIQRMSAEAIALFRQQR